MKKLLVTSIIALFVLSGCGEVKPEPTTTDTLEGSTKPTSDFQSESAKGLTNKTLTQDELKQILNATEVIETRDTGRTGFGGVKYSVVMNGEPTILITYSTFTSKEDLEKNYTQLKDVSPEAESLSFTDKGFFNKPMNKLIFITDTIKVDVRYTGFDEANFDFSLLTKLAESAYTKLTQ